jgi:hypothetical protein
VTIAELLRRLVALCSQALCSQVPQKELAYPLYVRHCAHIRMAKDETAENVKKWFEEAIRHLWPVAEGSLSFRKCPCIRRNCRVCASGEGHRSYVLYGRRGRERISVYVPEGVVPEVEKALENGRELQALMNEAGLRYLRARKGERRQKTGKNNGERQGGH